MSLQAYSLTWTDALIARVETHLRDIHSAIHQYYEKAGYPTSVEEKASPAAGDEEEGGEATSGTSTVDIVSPAGSFLLRTCVHAVPFESLHADRGVGADLVITMPIEKCGLVELQDGRYLACRQSFVEEIEAALNRLIHAATKKLADKASMQAKRTREHGGGSAANESGEEDEDEDEQRVASMAAAERLSRMTVRRIPIHGCYGNASKEIVRVRFLRRGGEANKEGGFHQRNTYETFYVDLHFRPAQRTGRVMSAAATRKHPYYSYLVLEDYMMPAYLKKIHKVLVAADGLRHALVILKCWAHHVGLMSSASGHQEGLNGFLLACMLLKLLEDGIITAATSEENAARAVWIRLSHGYFLPEAGVGKASRGVVPASEERGEVAVLRLSGEIMNVLFRSSTSFFKNAVQRAAEEALTHPIASHVCQFAPFQQLQLRYDVALTLRNTLSNEDEQETLATARDAEAIHKSTVFMSPLIHKINEVCVATLNTALNNRASFVSAWPTGPNTIQVIVQLTSEPDGRNHLTRGPAIEDTDAVAAFNSFWGANKTSTRQFPDGAIYRCVLWAFPEVVGTCATTALPASTVIRAVVEYALRKHANASTSVSTFLGGFEGFLAERIGAEWRDAAQLMQRSLREASLEVQKVIANLPRAVLPCKISEFCVIAASERNTEVFPIRPHFALTHTTDALNTESFAGLSTAATVEPIHCVMAIDDKGKIPDTLEAISLMKGAICAQLAKYIQQHYQKQTAGNAVIHAFASAHSVDLIYSGYLFRVYVAHYREVSLLRALQREAEAAVLEQKLFWTAQHSKFVSSISYGHHSYANAVRLAKRWVSAMMLYEFISPEAVELLVANAYLTETGSSTSTSTSGTTSTVMGAPRTSVSGFIRFLELLAAHDWKHPLILPFTDDEKDPATAARKLLRKPAEHQAMYIAAPYAPTESPFTFSTPRPMIMHRLVQLAKGALSLLMNYLSPLAQMQQGGGGVEDPMNGALAEAALERAIFSSNPVAFDFSMRFHPQLILQPDRCITVQSRPSASSCCGGDGHHHHAAGAGSSSAAMNGGVDTVSSPDAASAVGAAAGAGQVAAGVPDSKTLVRLRQLDELEKEQGREYIAALVEREPAAHAVRTIRAALRDKGMVFYDALAPASMYVVGVSTAPVLKKSQLMHEEILRMSRGALLPAPSCAFTRVIAISSAAAPSKETEGANRVDDKDPEALLTAAKTQHQNKRFGKVSRERKEGSGEATGKKKARTEGGISATKTAPQTKHRVKAK